MAYEEFAKVYDELIYEDINYDKISKRLISIIKKYNNKFNNYNFFHTITPLCIIIIFFII